MLWTHLLYVGSKHSFSLNFKQGQICLATMLNSIIFPFQFIQKVFLYLGSSHTGVSGHLVIVPCYSTLKLQSL